MKFDEFQKYLQEPLAEKWKDRFLVLHDYGNLNRKVIGFVLGVGEREDVTEWMELCMAIPPLYIIAGSMDGKEWIESQVSRKVQFLNGWYGADAFVCMLTVPLNRPEGK